MTSSDPPEGPEHHTGTLSPVSPKPLHIPSPANIPILESQMDSSLHNDDSFSILQPGPDPAEPNPSNGPEVHDHAHNDAPVADKSKDSDEHPGHSAPEHLNDAQQQHPTSQDVSSVDAADVSQDQPSLLQGALDHGALPSQASQPLAAPSADIPMPSVAALGGFNIQELLDNISASATSSTAPSGNVSSLPTGPNVPQDALNAASVQHTDIEQFSDLQMNGNTSAAEPSLSPSHQSPTDQSALGIQGSGTTTHITSQLTGAEPNLPTEGKGDPKLPQTTNSKNPPHPHNIDAKDGENVPWDKETQRKYDAFLDDERNHVLEGRWDRFPNGSRLFIGNLSSEKVTKRDLFHVFHRYGKLAQISIKQAYGFVQFLQADDCTRSLLNEQGVSIRGRKVHLEISKKQTPKPAGSEKKDDGGRHGRNRRSRTPERNRNGERNRRGGRGRQQDNYRPSRSPSPPRARGMGDQFRSRRSPDRYDGRRRSRSPSARDGRGSPSADDDLPIPRRAAHQVPDLQILNRDLRHQDTYFVDLVKAAFRQRGLSAQDVFTGGLNEAAVVRRQIFEGVLAVMRVSAEANRRQKYHLSVFARTAGAPTVRFEEYQDMDLTICIELVARAKQQAHQPQQADYGLSRFGVPSAPAGPPPAPMPHSFPGLPPAPSPGGFGMGAASPMAGPTPPGSIGGLDTAALQRLLQGAQNAPAGPGGLPSNMPVQPPSPLTPHGQGFGSGPAASFRPPQQAMPNAQPSGAPTFGGAVDVSGSGAGSASQAAGAAMNGTDIHSIIAQLGQYRQ